MSDRKNMNITRRQFVGGAAAAAATVTIVPGSYVLGAKAAAAPSNTVNVAQVGCGGKGQSDCRLTEQAGGNIVGVCDVDAARGGGTFRAYPKARKFTDFRKMFDTMGKDIDAVVVSTADHMHARISLQAMRMGKGVYCQKPLTHTVAEARLMTETAAKYKVATQMGNQGHSSGGNQATAEYIAAGAIGTVREVHIWTDRPVKWWPQGQGLPTGTLPVPKSLDWDLWLGVAPVRPYHKSYLPFVWRGWVGFGTGALGDIACHAMDSPFTVLGLTAPTSVKATCSPFNKVSFPLWSIIEYEYPAVGDRAAVKLVWYDGGKKPARPALLEKDRRFGGNGVLYVGDDGAMLGGGGGSFCRIIPEKRMKEFPKPKQTLQRPGGHYSDWIGACKGEKRNGKPMVAGSHFGYSGPMTEAVLLGNAGLYYPDQSLKWDPKTMTFPNNREANSLLTSEYRKGWTL